MTDPLRRFSRPQRARLRELAGAAWEAELVAGLEQLHADFGRWAADRLGAFELADRIHGFHDGTARALYNRYSRLDPVTAVAAAVARGLLDEAAIDAALLEKLQPDIDRFRRAAREGAP
jgi:hypothetical protein